MNTFKLNQNLKTSVQLPFKMLSFKNHRHNTVKHSIDDQQESNILLEQFEIEKAWEQESLQAQVDSNGGHCTQL